MHRLFIYLQNIIPLHVSSHKCSSSGGYIVYMQHIQLSLSTRARGGQSVHSCMYTMYHTEDEHLWLEACRGIIFYK